MAKNRLVSHAEAAQVWRRAGYSTERIEEVLSHLPDPIDTGRDQALLLKYGMSGSTLMDRMGSSP